MKFPRDQSREVCLAAVRQDGFALRFIKEQTEEICLAAVQQNGRVLHRVKKQTPELCLAAVQQDSWALEYVKEQTPEICLAAVQQTTAAYEFIKNKEGYLEYTEQRKKPTIVPYTFVKPTLSEDMIFWYKQNSPNFPLIKSDRFIFVSEISNCPGHCILLNPKTGQILPGMYHTDDLEPMTEDEV